MKVIYDDLCAEFGVKVMFATVLCDAEAEDDKIHTLIAVNKGGLSAWRAKVFVDCTGDGDLSAYAGAQIRRGMDTDASVLQPATHCFALGGVHEDVYLHGIDMSNPNADAPIHKMVASPEYPDITDTHFNDNKIADGAVGFNVGHLDGVDGTNPEDLSAAYVLGRKKAHELLRGLKEFYPEAFGDAYMLETAPLMGIRESRRVVCDYTLTLQDYLARRTFPDEISRNSYYIDVHLTPQDRERLAGIPEEQLTARYGKGESHGIPYRCLTPIGLCNLLVAGRIISCDRDVLGSVRVMPNCFTTGEAAGLAATIAAKENISVHDVDVDDLRDRLRAYGAYFL